MELTPFALVLIALLLAAWTVGAAVVVLRASAKTRRADTLQKSLRRMQHLLEVAPAVPMLVRVDGRIEGSERLARWLGLEKMPGYLSELATGEEARDEGGLTPEQLDVLTEKIRITQKSAAPFQLALTPLGSGRSLAFRGALADPQVSPGGAALVWVLDFTESEEELSRLREAASRAEADFAALVGLIEAAPVPMWFRGSDMTLRLVNQAYVEAVGASSAEQVVSAQAELLEPDESGRTPADLARLAIEGQEKNERIVAATVHGERRSLKVSDLPLGREGVAGYAIDIEEQQQVERGFRAYREAQRAMLDQLSVGVAQFDGEERLDILFLRPPGDTLHVVAAATGDTLRTFAPMEGGFMRGALRPLDRERRRHEVSLDAPYQVVREQSGRLTLRDEGSNVEIDVAAFGPTSYELFSSLLDGVESPDVPALIRTPASSMEDRP